MTSLAVPVRSPFRREDGTLTDAARRGKALFFSGGVGCATCHAGPRFTDSVLGNFVRHDVGTLGPGSGSRLGQPLDGLDTPSLRGVWDTAPYLHDGSAATLLDVLTTRNPADQHGRTSSLSASLREDLVAFLLSIDGSPVDEPTDADQDGISDQWEQLHGLNPASAADATVDSDGDGGKNRDEFAAGTDPRDPGSRLFVREGALDATGWAMSFPTVRGRSYIVERSATLAPGSWIAIETILGNGAEQIFSDPNASGPRQFYRLRVSR